jgi:hypothetical protein
MLFITETYKWFLLDIDYPSFSLIIYNNELNNKLNQESIDIIKDMNRSNIRLVNQYNDIYCIKKILHELSSIKSALAHWCNPFIIRLVIKHIHMIFIPHLHRSYIFHTLRLISDDINIINETNKFHTSESAISYFFNDPIKENFIYRSYTQTKSYYNNKLYINSFNLHMITNDQLTNLNNATHKNRLNDLDLHLFRIMYNIKNQYCEYYAIETRNHPMLQKLDIINNKFFIIIDINVHDIFKNNKDIDYYRIHKKYNTQSSIEKHIEPYQYKTCTDENIKDMIPTLSEINNLSNYQQIKLALGFYTNPNIFTYDYKKIKEYKKEINESIMCEIYKPSRIAKYLEINNDVEDYMN